MSVMITCPDCDKTLKVKDEAVGKKVRCPACSNVFTARSKPKNLDDNFLDDLEKSAPPKRKRRVVEDDQDDEEQLPARKSRSVKSASTKEKPKKSDSKAILIGLGVFSGVCAVICGGALVYGFMSGIQKASVKQAQQVQPANWTTFKHPSGLAQIDMPGVPSLDAKQSVDGAQNYALTTSGYRVSLTALILPGETNAVLAQNPVALDLFCTSIVEKIPQSMPGVQMISTRRFTSGTVPGVEMKFSVQGNVINLTRYFVFKEGIIYAEFITRNEATQAGDRERFFKSIRGPDGNLIGELSESPVNSQAPSEPTLPIQPASSDVPSTISQLDKPAATSTNTTTSATSSPDGSTTVTTTTKETRQNNQGGTEARTSTRTRRSSRTTGIRHGGPSGANSSKGTLVDARSGFQTKLVRQDRSGQPVPEPPAKLAKKISYDAPSGKLAAYVTTVPSDGQKHPAIVWITGGDCNSIDDSFFKPAPANNDQTASAFRDAGIVTMYPSLRGGNDNPGVKESFLGEVDDVVAAADFLSKLDGIDPDRIYLAGHSTGGTLVLLVAAMPNDFRAIFFLWTCG